MILKENEVYCMDAREGFKLLNKNSVDLILTDPPYVHKDVWTYGILAKFGSYVLKRDGFLLMDVGRGHFLPSVFSYFASSSLFFQKILCSYLFSDRFSVAKDMHDSFFLHCLYAKSEGYLFDVNDVYVVKGFDSRRKGYHKWEKDVDMYEYYIKVFTKKGDLVVDPFCGSGTCLLACKKLNRRYIGFDIDPKAVEITKKRLAKHL